MNACVDTRNVSSAAQPRSLPGLSVAWHHGGHKFVSGVYELNLSEAFIEAAEPPPPGTALKLVFRTSDKAAHARAIVRRSVPGDGMGVAFVALEQEDRAILAVAAESANASPGPARNAAQDHKDRAPAAVERRAHARSRMTAQVKVADPVSGNTVAARLGNLSAGGCLLELEPPDSFSLGTAVTVTITRGSESFQSEARVVYILPRKGVGLAFTHTEPQHIQLLVTWVMETIWLASDRRRSQRLFLSVPVAVMGQDVSGASFSEETQTVKVSADGCSVVLAAQVERGRCVTLLNTATNALTECVIVRVEQSPDGRREIGMVFTLSNKSFWHIHFPPSSGLTYQKSASSDPVTTSPARAAV